MTIKLYRGSLYNSDVEYNNVNNYEYHSEDKRLSFTGHDGRFDCMLMLKEGDLVVIDTLAEV